MRFFLILLISIIALYGCSSQEIENVETNYYPAEKVTEEKTETNPDYRNMFIENIKDNLIVIAPHATDPEASYPVYEIFIDENTNIEGSKQKLDELVVNDDVKVWIKKIDDDKEIAERIFVHE
ncbi:hypothetical protein F9U64_22530 [Gracilibacillus oryzae]|uniref:DUF3221 domain-containing protein n=1 Tax=Gracilibacillus oryzae TaxID=1672701 RepID=A0A7C8GQ38_9BACI|nr:hypothetical protein [Gracilibacillus oryzae]KAB8125505.1 hypothetical protein F9U64_22530 [Gracilibacillus oryzae]